MIVSLHKERDLLSVFGLVISIYMYCLPGIVMAIYNYHGNSHTLPFQLEIYITNGCA